MCTFHAHILRQACWPVTMGGKGVKRSRSVARGGGRTHDVRRIAVIASGSRRRRQRPVRMQSSAVRLAQELDALLARPTALRARKFTLPTHQHHSQPRTRRPEAAGQTRTGTCWRDRRPGHTSASGAKGRLGRDARFETLRAHHFGSPSCKPSAGSPSRRRMTPRSTKSDRPEQTTLYRLVQLHAAAFIAETELATGGRPAAVCQRRVRRFP